tara:strand:+ start:167 stop:343 length:177 start_codon:yes stop_codon:yes gene_type:complete
MATKIVRTVIGGHVIETPVEVLEVACEVKETPKPKRGRSTKKEEKETPEVSEAPASVE